MKELISIIKTNVIKRPLLQVINHLLLKCTLYMSWSYNILIINLYITSTVLKQIFVLIIIQNADFFLNGKMLKIRFTEIKRDNAVDCLRQRTQIVWKRRTISRRPFQCRTNNSPFKRTIDYLLGTENSFLCY